MISKQTAKPCAAYTENRLAEIYDALNPWAQSDLFYLDLVDAIPLRILDIGCGTGRLAVEFAQRGHQVTGVDPAAGMLAVARVRPGGTAVTWIDGDVTAVPAAEKFDLVIMSGNVFQVFLRDEDIRKTLSAIAALLSPQGRLAFETRNPLVREWESWIPAETAVSLNVSGAGKVDVHYDVTGVEYRIVSYETHFRFADGETVVARSALRFSGYDEVLGFLRDAGLALRSIHGDWDMSDFTEDSPEIIVIAGRSRV